MRTQLSWTAAASAIAALMLALAPRASLAQSTNPFDRADVPAFVQNFTGGTVRERDEEIEYQLYVMGAFNGKKRVDSYGRAEA